MKWIRLLLSLVIFVPAWALIGAMSTLDSGFPAWSGVSVGASFGLLCGLVFGRVRGRWLDYIFGPIEEPKQGK
jgi:hypothetical protein